MHGEALSPAPSTALTVTVHGAAGVSMVLPAVIARAGEHAARTTLEFFTARIPNAHTRRAYGRAVFAFCAWCERERVSLERLDAPTASVYLGLSSSICNHSFRATGITIHQENQGRLEDAQALAGHADARTTRLYVRAERKIGQAEVERVQL